MHLRNILLLVISATSAPVFSSPVSSNAAGLGSLLSARQQNIDEFKGKGRILVINSNSYVEKTPFDKLLGCINADGKVVPISVADKSSCGVFERKTWDHGNKLVSLSKDSNCTFHNKLQPANLESYYGKDPHALFCGKTEVADWETGWNDLDHFYSINGFPHPYICNGNIACYYDVKDPPQGRETNFDPMDIWVFYWGGHEMDGVKGHLMVLLLWHPVSE